MDLEGKLLQEQQLRAELSAAATAATGENSQNSSDPTVQEENDLLRAALETAAERIKDAVNAKEESDVKLQELYAKVRHESSCQDTRTIH